jgi:multidrug resistance efflux pump
VSSLLLLGLALVAQAAKDAPASSLLASHIGMELDDLDYEIRRQESALQLAKGRLISTQRALQRGVASRSELEQVNADVRSLEAREAEAVAFRDLKEYQRDVLNGTVQADDEKIYALLLDLLKKQETMAQVELDLQGYLLKQDDALLARGAIGRPERDGVALDFDMARLHVALSRTRQAQLALEHASKPGPKAATPSDGQKLKIQYLQSRVQYYEIGAAIAKSRVDMAKDQLRHGLMTASDVDYYEKALDAAEQTLAAERKRLEQPDAPAPASLPRAG